jgi:hypothetical protein
MSHNGLMNPYLCNESYAIRWSSWRPMSHETLRHQRRGAYWLQITAVPGEHNPAEESYQFAEYNHGYSIGHRGDCQDAEWYIGWLNYHAHGLNTANSWLLGYIHGKHLRVFGTRCPNDRYRPKNRTWSKSMHSFAELAQAKRHGVKRQPKALVERELIEAC